MEQQLIKVKDTPGFHREKSSNALLNTDVRALTAYKQKRNKEAEIKNAVMEINNLKQELTEVKQLLLLLVKNQGQ